MHKFGSMVTVYQAQMPPARSSRRLQKSSTNDDDVRNTSAGRIYEHSSEHDMAAETLPTRSRARLSGARLPSQPTARDDRAVVANKSAELNETMETEQLSSSSSSSSSSKKSLVDMPSPGLSPIRRKESKDAANQSTVPQGLVALPVVTRSTRRQTFASANAPAKKERKAKSIGETSPQSSTSSGVDENIMDLFAPPQPVRTRSRQSSVHTVNPLATELSSPTAEVVTGGRSSQRNKKAQDPPSSSPPSSNSKGKSRSSPKTPLDPKAGADAADRKAMSTTNKKYGSSATLVHVPHPSQGSNFDPFATYHKSPTWEMDAMQKSIESAPARMPIARHAMPESNSPQVNEISYTNINASDEEMHAALQLSFEESPEGKVSGYRRTLHGKKPRSSMSGHPQQQQQQQQQQAGHPFYHHQGHPMMSAPSNQSYMYPPAAMSPPSQQQGYLPPGYPVQWGGSPAAGGYYSMFPNSEDRDHLRMLPPNSVSRTPAKRKAAHQQEEDVNVTTETMDTTCDESFAGPFSPPSAFKRQKDASQAHEAWPSPPRQKERTGTPGTKNKALHPRTPNIEQTFSFGIGGITPSKTEYPWSPSGLNAFFEEEGNNELLHFEQTPTADRNPTKVQQVEEGEVKVSRSTFTSNTSPTRGGFTIKGSPIVPSGKARPDSTPSSKVTISQKKTSSDEKMEEKVPWRTPSSASSGVRVKIGHVGFGTKGIEGINSVLRGSPVETVNHHHMMMQPGPHQMVMRYDVPSHFAVAPEMAKTPGNSVGVGVGGTPPGSNTKYETAAHPPCHCKKSKCLKLYCDCFASERYCSDCKCSNCQNSPEFEDIRSKAIADTRSKNPNAFKPRISKKLQSSGLPHSPPTAHATGCRCKKSACLKKYCECFTAGVVCGGNCKCEGCKNFVGSQALIDRRRKMKDTRGAEIAMRESEEAWKGKDNGQADQFQYGQSQQAGAMAPGQFNFSQGGSPLGHHPHAGMTMVPMHSMASTPNGRPMYAPLMMGHSPMMLAGSPMFMNTSPPNHQMMHHPHPTMTPQHSAHYAKNVPAPHHQHSTAQEDVHIPKATQSMMIDVNTRSSGRRMKKKSPIVEPRAPYFGDKVKQPRSTALNVFSFLDRDELFNASVVSKSWNEVLRSCRG